MKLVNFLAICIVVSILTGCLYGQCMNGACSLEREHLIRSIKPFVEYWNKLGVPPESRLSDWVSCGGYGDGSFTLQSKKMFSGDDDNKAYKRLRTEMYRCLIGKGYRYGPCDDPAFVDDGDGICGGK